MPGPRSAPNGDWKVTQRCGPDTDKSVKSGKTAYKRGEIKHATKKTAENKIQQGMAEFREQERRTKKAS